MNGMAVIDDFVEYKHITITAGVIETLFQSAPKVFGKLDIVIANAGIVAGIFTGVSDDDPYKRSLLETVPIGRLATPDDVADVAEFLASDQSFFITGEEILMNGGSSN
jgi:NAD(P)-dependent dehydrogenase (short-subunit alcohol dehydrogenase family)